MSPAEASLTPFRRSVFFFPFSFKCVYDTVSDTADKKQRQSGASTTAPELPIFVQHAAIKKEATYAKASV